MKRLRDEIDSSDPQLVAAGRLVQQIAPLPHSEVRARRVWRALERKGARGLRGRLVVIFALLGLTGSAAAAFGVTEWFSGRKTEQGAGDKPKEFDSGLPTERKGDVAAPHSGESQRELSGRDPSEKEATEKDLAEMPGAKTEQVEWARASDRTQRSPSAASAASRTAASAPKLQQKPAPTLSEARLVKEAVEALRSGDDPEKAERLLSEYRKNSSSGHLDEEALALTIEVALARKSPEAARYARLYLQKYPGGKFAPLAKRVLQSQ